jgi:hypothetical protein
MRRVEEAAVSRLRRRRMSRLIRRVEESVEEFVDQSLDGRMRRWMSRCRCR